MGLDKFTIEVDIFFIWPAALLQVETGHLQHRVCAQTHHHQVEHAFCKPVLLEGYKGMSSVLADQWRPSYVSLNAGGGGVAGS